MAIQRIFFVGVCLLMAACTTGSQQSRNSVSSNENARLNLQMGVRYLDMGMLDVAKQKLERAYELDSDNVEIHNALAVLNERIKKNQSARFHFEKAMELSPENASVKNNYGRFLCKQGDLEKGIQLLNEAFNLPLNNRKWFALTNLGICYVKQEKQELAEQAFRQALQSKSNYAPALMQMQNISYRKRNYLSARAFMERYLAVAKQTPESLWVAIQTERALGNRELTDRYRQQLLRLFPASQQAQQIRSAINR